MDEEKPEVVPPWKVPKQARPLTLQEQSLVSDVMQNGGEKARVIAKRNGMSIPQMERTLAKPQVSDYVLSVMEEMGAYVKKACKVLGEAMEAEDMRVVSGGKGAPARIESAGPDHKIRVKAAELVLRIHKFMNNLKEDGGAESGGISELLYRIRQAREERGRKD